MTDKLKLGKGFSITVEQMLQRWAILGMSGAGKSNTAVVMVEEMYRAGIPFCVIDPKGDWWGVRSSKTGKSAGLDIPIFGGEHGDIPLYADGGAVMADAVAAQEAFTQSIIDVSQFEDQELLRFLMDFADRIYKVNRKLVILVLEEADEYIPQNKESPEQAKSVGKWSRIVKRGRTRGLLTVLVALRNSELAKSVLNFSDSVVVHRATAKLDREAVKGWVEYSGASKEILDSMPTLDDGEVWVSSPQKLKMTKRLRIFRRHTFDSGATPDLDTDRARVTMKEVDLGAIEERMKETIERAKAEDPAELRKQIAGLRSIVSKLETEKPEPPPAPEPEAVEVKVPVFGDDGLVPEDLRKMVMDITTMAGATQDFAERMGRQVDRAEQLVNGQPKLPPKRAQSSAAPSAVLPAPPPPPAAPKTPAGTAGGGNGGNADLTGPQRKVLDACAWLEEVGFPQPTKLQVGFIAGYRVGKKVGGTYGNILGGLRSSGLIEYPADGLVELTSEGRENATVAPILQTTAGLQGAIMARLRGPEQRVLQPLIDCYPDSMSKPDVGAAAGYSVGDKVGGTFGNILGKLRTLGLIDYPSKGDAAAEPVLFLEGR